jgi:uncharacterized protein YabE (DUF348 family)
MQNIFKKLQRHKKTHIRRFKRWRKHPFGLPIALFIVLVLLGGAVVWLTSFRNSTPALRASTSNIVILSHDHAVQTIPTKAPTVGALLKKLDISLATGDRVEPSLNTQILQDNFHVNIYRAVPVVVSDGTQQVQGLSAATTPRSIATQAGLTVYPEDTITTSYADDLISTAGVSKQVTVTRSMPINLNLYGTPITVRTQAKTVGELVKEKNIKLVSGATIAPAASTPLTPDLQVFVLNKGVLIASSEETIPTPVQNVDDNNLTLGSSAVRQQGSPGKQLVTYQIQIDSQTGKEVNRTAIQTVVTQAPVAQIVAVGKNVAVPKDKVAIMQAVGIAESDYGYVDYIVSHEGGWGGTTKSNYGGSGAYGICQALPGSKMASAGADWATNPVTQLKWCNGYALGRYGSWEGAYNYWLSHHYW